MSQADNTLTLDNLASTLTQDLNQSADGQRAAAIAELEAFIASVPPRAEFSDGRKWFYRGIAASVVLFFIAGWALFSGQAAENSSLLWIMAGLGVIGLLMAWQHRNAGKNVHMVMTHHELTIWNLSGPVKLVDVVDLGLSEYQQTEIAFTMRPGAHLPISKVRRGFYPAQGVVKARGKAPRVLVYTSGHTINGKKASVEEAGEIIGTYLSVSQAHEQLAALRAGAPL